jgi:hypothetical protein
MVLHPYIFVIFKVFSFYKNKITRLPPYLLKFTRLLILRAEQNPWEWPPKGFMEAHSMAKDFVKTFQQWVEDNAPSELLNLSVDTALREELGPDPRR